MERFSAFMKVETGYDAMSRKTVEASWGWNGSSWVESGVTQYSYDGAGRLECTAVRMNPAAFGSLPASACSLGTQGSDGPDRITRNAYDAADQLLQVQKAYGTAIQQNYATYTYSPNGKQTSVTDASGNYATMAYDGFDRLAQWTFPSPTSAGQVNAADYESYGYDANGNRTSLRKRDGRTLSYGYDALNRMTSKVASSGERSVYYDYDLRGLQLHARFDSASGGDMVANSYDGFGNIASTTTSMGGVSRTLSFQYDADNNRIRVTHPDSVYFTYGYDGLDRLALISQSGSSTVAARSYNAQGLRASETRGAVTTSYGYDPVQRLASLGDDLAGTPQDVTSTFGYNPAGQIAGRTRSNDIYAFSGYVAVNRSYAANGLNQYTSAGPATFTYDANGNLTSDGSTTYVYDTENRLVSASGGATGTLTYDPLGRLWQTTGSSGTTQFIYDGDQLTLEYDGSGNLLRRYVHGTADDDPMIWYEGAGLTDRRSLQTDWEGSIVSVANAAGSSLAIDSYDEYGIPGNPGSPIGTAGRFRYTGQAWIPELGIYYYKARMYSASLGRFMQTDPVGYKDQINLYVYVGNDPINKSDPSGTYICSGSKENCGAVM